MLKLISNEINVHLEVISNLDQLVEKISKVAVLCTETINNGGKVILFGNGGSAADAQHIAAEMVGRFEKSRKGLPSIALTTDTSILTSIGNDFGFEFLFSRQVEAIANSRDLVIGLSTSGNSKNVINGFIEAKKIGCKIVGFSGKNIGKMDELCDLVIHIPSHDTPRIQEGHILIGHIVCKIIDSTFSSE